MSARRLRRRFRGFSLIEVMVASALFLTTTAVIVASVATASRNSAVQRRMTVALQLGEQKMEELLLRFNTSEDLTIGEHPADPISGGNKQWFDESGEPSTAAANKVFRVDWKVSSVTGIPNLRRIALTVAWEGRDNDRDHQITLTTDRP
jgi:prepilin-type N-terminal cleavage/methylation domain-containing protein